MTRVTYDFTGSVVLVTGGASGIGRATAIACAQHGAQVVVADVNAAGLASLAGTERIDARTIDVGDPVAVAALVQDIERRYGRVDAAVLAAAIQARTPIAELTDAEWRRHMAVNLDGVFYAMRALTPIMQRQRRGAILAFTSGLATLGWPGAAAYATTKAGLVGLIKCAAHELRPYGVRANLLSPGLVATPVFLDVASADELAMYRNSVGVSTSEEVVPTVLHLISDASASLTGAVIERRLVPPR
jgi:NAD(P)-dependent dehydrogenase (short-subunit alcohol dehydrogenase family)